MVVSIMESQTTLLVIGPRLYTITVPKNITDSIQAKKARCSGLKPCATCISKGIDCTYETQYLRGRPPTPPLSTPEADPGEQDIQAIMPQHAQFRSPTSQTLSSSIASDKAIMRVAENTIPGVEGNELIQSVSRSSPEVDTAEMNGEYVDRTSGLSFLQRARSRLKTRSAPSADQVERSRQPLTVAGDKPLLGVSSDGLTVNPVILPAIPDSAQAFELLDLYFDVCVATYKPLHRPTIDAWYRVIAANVAQGLPMTKTLGNARVSTVLSIFAVTTFHRQKSRGFSDDVSSLSDSDTFFKCSMALTESETGGPHLESAQARLVQVFYLLMTCRMNQAWYIFGSLLQIISALGMHRRDRRKMHNTTSKPDYAHSQCRKRTFWSAYILDKYMGVVMGRPRHFHDKDIDQEYPDRANDENVTPLGLIPSESDGIDDCHLDGFIWNTRLASIVGEISDELYPINPLPESRRVKAAEDLAVKLDKWYASLPVLLKARPSSLVRSFRRQCVALRLAYKHAVVHLHRPFLLVRSSGEASMVTESAQLFQKESIRLCIGAARDALRTIDTLAQEGPLFHAFWWTHYITFCALTVTYVWNMQRSSDLEGIDRGELMTLAERCQIHLAHATATNSPSRRYSIILEELRSEATNQRPMDSRASDQGIRGDSTGLVDSTIVSGAGLPVSDTFDTSNVMHPGLVDNTSVDGYNPFMDWQTSDWLELDASVCSEYHAFPSFTPS
jgi:hypothetical protein